MFEGEADYAERVFGRLRIPDVIGKPRMSKVCGPWFLPIVRALFGSYDEAANRRMIQELALVIPKKNGKSSSGGALSITALIVNRRPNAELIYIAPTKLIADIAYLQAENTIKADPALVKLFHVQRHIRRITNRETDAVGVIKAADTDTITGNKATYALVDETHELALKPRSQEALIEIRGALAARPDGFVAHLTTQSKAPPAGIFKSELAKWRAIRDGQIEAPILPIIYELPEDLAKDGGWKNRKYWGLVNPNLGRSVDEAFLAQQIEDAEREGPEKLALIASQHFNVEIGVSFRSDHWPGVRHWEKRAQERFSLKDLIELSDVVTVGCDGGGLDDMLALAVLGRDKGNPKVWRAWTHCWIHETVLELRKSETSRFKDFERDGDLTIVSAMRDGFSQLADMVDLVNQAGKLVQVGVDPAGVKEIADELASRGITEDGGQVVGVGQGFRLNGVIKSAEGRLSDGLLVHAGQPIMAWCVGNAKLEAKGNAMLITKQASGVAKIDALMALFDAVDRMLDQPDADRSVYEERGLMVFG